MLPAIPTMFRSIVLEHVRHALSSNRRWVDMLFAHLKRILRLDRLSLRGQTAPKVSSYWPPRPKI